MILRSKCMKSKTDHVSKNGIAAVTPEEYHKRIEEFYAAGDVAGFLEFQKTHSVLYADPIPEQDKEILKDMEVPELPDDIEPILM